jgi:hypothetical protein
MEYSASGRSNNALQRVVFIVQFKKEFSEQDFVQFDKNSKQWRGELPRRSVSNAVLLQPGANRVAFDEERIVGLSYEALMKDGSVEFGLRFDENRILFLAGRYTRWTDIWPQAQKFLQSATDLVPKENPVAAFASEYSDLFRATGEYADFEASGILRLGSRFIPSHVFDRKENFHFHTGFFEMHSEPARHRVLTRVNADLRDNDEEKARDLSIVLFHQISAYRESWGDEIMLDDAILERGLENFVALHEIDKAILREILNDHISNGIGL